MKRISKKLITELSIWKRIFHCIGIEFGRKWKRNGKTDWIGRGSSKSGTFMNYCVAWNLWILYNVIKIQSLGSFVDTSVFLNGYPLRDYQQGVSKWPHKIFWYHNILPYNPEYWFTELDLSKQLFKTCWFFLDFPKWRYASYLAKRDWQFLKLIWTCECRNFVMMNLTYARKRRLTTESNFKPPGTPWQESMCRIQYWRLCYSSGVWLCIPIRNTKTEEIVLTDLAKKVGILFCKMRGLEHSYPRSDLRSIWIRYHV